MSLIRNERQLSTLTPEEIDMLDLELIHAGDCRFKITTVQDRHGQAFETFALVAPLGTLVHLPHNALVIDVWYSASALTQSARSKSEPEAKP